MEELLTFWLKSTCGSGSLVTVIIGDSREYDFKLYSEFTEDRSQKKLLACLLTLLSIIYLSVPRLSSQTFYRFISLFILLYRGEFIFIWTGHQDSLKSEDLKREILQSWRSFITIYRLVLPIASERWTRWKMWRTSWDRSVHQTHPSTGNIIHVVCEWSKNK